MKAIHHLALAGCGGMGRRHLRGYKLSMNREPNRFKLSAVIDTDIKRANFLASEAENLLNHRPLAFTSVEEAASRIKRLNCLDIVTSVSSHPKLTTIAAELGLHVLCEKPMAATLEDCKKMQKVMSNNNLVLSIAENYRRDPLSRLTKALLNEGAIGEIRSLLDITASGGSQGHAGPWRYLNSEGGPILEAGVHNADMQLFLCGNIKNVMATTKLNEPIRDFKNAKIKPFHDHYAQALPLSQTADTPDMLMAIIEFENGLNGQWLYDHSAHGPSINQFTIFGSEGQLNIQSLRSGKPLIVFQDKQKTSLSGEEILALVPKFNLDARTSMFFGGSRLTQYDNKGMGLGAGADIKLLAIELGEFLDAIEKKLKVEIGPLQGMLPVAIILACLESARTANQISIKNFLTNST